MEQYIRKEPMQIDIVESASQAVKSTKKAQEAESTQVEPAKDPNKIIKDFSETKITKLDVDDFPDLTKESICND